MHQFLFFCDFSVTFRGINILSQNEVSFYHLFVVYYNTYFNLRSSYEIERENNLKENQKKLAELGLNCLPPLFPSQPAAPPKKQRVTSRAIIPYQELREN